MAGSRRSESDATGMVLGREAELAMIMGFLSGAPGSALVLEGEPGIGKTTLWRAGIAEAGRHGLRLLACSPLSGETQLSFAAVGDLLGDAFADAAARLPTPQRRALAVALLLEEPSQEPDGQRTVAAATLSVFRELARKGPLLLAIDDVQWLDEPSAEALAFAARRLGDAPVSVLAARRLEVENADRLPLEIALEQRARGDVARLHIGPLSPGTLHEIIRDRLDVVFQPGVLERVRETSGGNPFFALELARALLHQGEPPVSGQALPVPAVLGDLVRERLDTLPDSVQELLSVVAALSDPTLDTVVASGVGAAIDEAVAAGVLEVDAGGRLRFTHPLFASGSYRRLGPQARRALHRRLAAVVDGEERARHLALGASGPSGDIAATLYTAARKAAARGAIGPAAELADQSVRLTPPDQTDEIMQRRLDAAGYEMRHGETDRARTRLEPLLHELPAGPTRAVVLLRLARLGEHSPAGALELCRKAFAEAGESGRLAAEARQLAAEMSMLSGDVRGGLEHARVACRLAENAGDDAILVESLGTLCHYETYTGSITPGLIERAVELERQSVRPSHNYSPREILGLRLMYADRLDEARHLLEASYVAATDLGDELDRGSLLIHLTQLECRAGRLAEAYRHACDATLLHEQVGGWMPASARFVTALAGAHVGRIDEARSAGEEGAALGAEGGNQVFRVLNLWALGFLELSLGDSGAAHRYLHSLPDAVDSMGYRNPGVRPIYADAIEARIGVGDLDVDDRIDELERRGRALDNPWARAASARCRGLLRAARGDPFGAIAELERALVEHGQSLQPVELGRTLLVLGSSQRRARQRAAARSTLTRALELFDSLGAPLWAEKAAAELARIPGRGAASGELTETERRVAELVAEGLSNKEVAARLFVTVRTIEANLTKVYGKLGIHSRTELASRLH